MLLILSYLMSLFLYLIFYLSSVISVKKAITDISEYLGSRLLAHDEDSTGDYLFWSDVDLIPYKGVDPTFGSLLHCRGGMRGLTVVLPEE